jgi:hypothetical protein
MAINNRSLDASEQRTVSTAQLGAVGGSAAETHMLYTAPRPQLVEQIKVAAQGVTGTFATSYQLQRFTSAGVTVIGALAATLTVVAFGTSGLQSVTFSASFLLQANDNIQLAGGGSNIGCTDLVVTTVVKNLEDIKSNFGTTY